MGPIRSGDIDEAVARGVTGLLVGVSVGLLTWFLGYSLFMYVLAY
jgi:hypothetical protein